MHSVVNFSQSTRHDLEHLLPAKCPMLVAQPEKVKFEKIRLNRRIRAMTITTSSQGKASAEINVTPMIDVLLVLLNPGQKRWRF